MDKKKLIILAVIVIAFIVYSQMQRNNDNPRIFYRKKLVNNYNGYAIPPIGIFIKESEMGNKSLHQHERTHWLQFQREGLLPFLFNYGKEALNKGYDKNPYEIEARVGESNYCKENLYRMCKKRTCENCL